MDESARSMTIERAAPHVIARDVELERPDGPAVQAQQLVRRRVDPDSSLRSPLKLDQTNQVFKKPVEV